MMRPRIRLALVGATALSLMFTVGCTADERTIEPRDGQSPLDAYVLRGHPNGDLSVTEQLAANRASDLAVENDIAACMKRLGFTYAPETVPLEPIGVISPTYETWRVDDEEWVAEWGYGIVKWPGSAEEFAAAAEAKKNDPNPAYLASLTPPERLAYEEAMHGHVPGPDEIADGAEYDPSTAGCAGAARSKVNDQSLLDTDEFAKLNEAIDKVYHEVRTNKDLPSQKAWSACMSAAGAGAFDLQSDAWTLILNESNEIFMKHAVYLRPDGTPEDNGDTEPWDQANDPEMLALHDKSVDLALTDLECRKTTKFAALERKERFAREEEFIEEHRAELDAFAAAAEVKVKRTPAGAGH